MCLEASVLGFGRKLPPSSIPLTLKPLSLPLVPIPLPYTLPSFLTRCGNLFSHDHKIMPLPRPFRWMTLDTG